MGWSARIACKYLRGDPANVSAECHCPARQLNRKWYNPKRWLFGNVPGCVYNTRSIFIDCEDRVALRWAPGQQFATFNIGPLLKYKGLEEKR